MLRDRWLSWRNAFLASARFHRFALRFPPTRPIARQRARQLFDIVAGFTYSQTLFACVELDLFARLAGGPVKLADLASTVGLTSIALDRLVGAASALGLTQRLAGERVALGPLGAALLGNPAVVAMVVHHRHLYADLADPVRLLRQPGGGALADFWNYARGGEPAAVAAYSALMAASLPPVAAELFDAYDITRHRRLLDVAGGEGAFLAEARRRAPGLELGLFDLPAVIERARTRPGRGIAFYSGDFRIDPLPSGYDCITLVRVLHDHDDEVALELLRSIRVALPQRGRLLIVEPMLDAPGARTVGATYFALYLLALGNGRARSAGEIGEIAKRAGFARWRTRATCLPLTAGIVVASTA